MEWYEMVMWTVFVGFVSAAEIADNPTAKGFTAAALMILGVYTFFVK